MAVAFDESVSGKMFAAGFHAAPVQTFLQGKGKLSHGVGVAVETAVADDGACSPVEVEDGREGEVYAAGGQLRRPYPADPLAPSDGASNAGPVEGEPAAGAAFQLDQPYTLSDSSVLKISSPVKQKHSYAGTEYYKFTVSYTNNSPKEFQPMSLVVQATTGTQTAESTIDSANKCDVTSTDVLPGKTLEWTKCFLVPDPAKPFNLQWEIFLSPDKGNGDGPPPPARPHTRKARPPPGRGGGRSSCRVFGRG